MSMSPGPWKYEASNGEPGVGMVYDANGGEVTIGHCGCCFPGDEHVSEDDGKAIAKVPEMVAMLRKLEWSGTPEGGGRRRCCPECDEPKPTHYPDCALDTLLKALP